ncbi:MAG TPA: sodium:proton antiporter [Xanthobacteraceae bacterium]|jgi:Na+/H+ antiporter NhaD/arsenite permease-like protein|nr:sodium:proton antiporter [Xanthobacteraceae bacterium]
MLQKLAGTALFFSFGFASQSVQAAPTVPDGAGMSWPWALPFAGILLTIATGPLLFPKFWHRHYGKIAALWSALTLIPIILIYSLPIALDAFLRAMLTEYLGFIVLLFALFTVAGGIVVTGDLRGTPTTNVLILGLGTTMASVVGTTGAAMILIRPLIRANAARRDKMHTFVFFIFLVANIGGALTPLGDPPLFIGFLHGVDFLWTTRHLFSATLFVAGLVLAIFFVLDSWFYHRGGTPILSQTPVPKLRLHIRGSINLFLIGAIVAAVLVSGAWKPGISFAILGVEIELQNLVRDGLLLLVALASLALTPDEHREANGFSWEPIKEVVKLFAGIFICIIPVLAMLRAGANGPLAPLLALMSDGSGRPQPLAYFWMTGILSAFLDNAPTYLVFFNMAGGNPSELMGPLASTLTAISMGAVYLGAMTYIGNAPNFMIYAITTERGIPMPSFFGFIIWSTLFLLPVFALTAWIFLA